MARRNPLIGALLLAVLLGHALVLQWLAWQAQEQSALRLLAVPMFTRLLQPEPPPPPVAAKTVRLHAPPAPAVIESVARSAPAEATTSVAPPQSTPEAVASEPAQATSTAAGTATEEALTPTPALPATTAATAMPSPATLDSWPADTRLSYRLGGYFRGEIHGNARVQWQRDGDRYQTRIDIDLGVVSLVMTSQGVVTEQGLAPNAYEETRVGKRRSVTLQGQEVTLSDGNRMPRPDGVQDTASQFVELSHRFASGQVPLEVGRSVSFWMARPGGLDYWTYDVTDKEVLQTPQLGAVEAFHLKPRPTVNPRGNITAEMWFAPSLQYLPVRIRVTAGDANLDLLVDQIEQR
ncbi:MAG: DUF3108 domain-containing protein [Ramlibacter sp.]|nr:DUF3108 domain-containing protein [Ramlibacter sp.]